MWRTLSPTDYDTLSVPYQLSMLPDFRPEPYRVIYSLFSVTDT